MNVQGSASTWRSNRWSSLATCHGAGVRPAVVARVPGTAALVAVLLLFASIPGARGQGDTVFQRVGFDQRLEAQLPLELEFRDESGRSVQLQRYFGSRPVVLCLVYYDCPMLCTLELTGLVRTLRSLDFDAGRQYEVLVVSFDPRETPALAQQRKRRYVAQYARPGTEGGWHFLTGETPSIEALTQAVGFRYEFDEERGEYAHASGIVLITPGGVVSRYFFGIEYPTRDVRLGLVEASGGRVGSPADRLLLLCYGYDPATGRYGLLVMNVIRLLGGATVLALGTFIGVMLYRDRRASRGGDLAAGRGGSS